MVNQYSAETRPAEDPVETGIPSPFVIRAQTADDIDKVVAFALRAWKPVHESMARVLGPRINQIVFPDWAASQAREVEEACHNENTHVWLAEVDGHPAGFVAVVFRDNPSRGEIDLIAVDPEYQGRGIGTALTSFALERISAAGVPLAFIATGGDDGHAAARRTYEKAGLTALPLVSYYKALPGIHTD